MDISGSWINQLDTTIIFEDDGKGRLTGTIVCDSGEFAGDEFPVVGAYDVAPTSSTTAVAFLVNWANADANGHSVTAWSGQCDDHTGTIVATWTLTKETGVDPPDEWHSTLTGQDRFRRDVATMDTETLAGCRPATHRLTA